MFVAAMCGGAMRSHGQMVVYNLAADWSNVNNPNGPWRLYQAPGQLFATNQPDYWSDGTNQRAWADQPYPQNAHVPFWMKVTDNRYGSFATVGTIAMHTAESGRTGTEFSSVTWTSPADGTALLSGGAWMLKSFDRPQRWELRLNGVSLTSGDLTLSDSFTQANPFNFASGSGGASAVNLALRQNDVVELVFFRQSSGTPGTLVGLDFSVGFTPVPEPDVMPLLAVGLVVVGAARWRRGRTARDAATNGRGRLD